MSQELGEIALETSPGFLRRGLPFDFRATANHVLAAIISHAVQERLVAMRFEIHINQQYRQREAASALLVN
jgi:hypothetical protein